MTTAPKLTLHAEDIQVTRTTRDVGSVSVSVSTLARDHPVDETLTSTRVDVRHVPVDRLVDQMPQSRQEGDTLIIPVVEVVVTRFLVREEIHVIRTVGTRRHQGVVTLRREQAVVTRSDAGGSPPPQAAQQNQEEQDNGE